MYIVNVNNFRPFDLFILLNAAFRNSNIAFSHAALDICLQCAYNALKRNGSAMSFRLIWRRRSGGWIQF